MEPGMTYEELRNLALTHRPSLQKLNKISDEVFVRLVQTKIDEWATKEMGITTFTCVKRGLPSFLQGLQILKLFRLPQTGEGNDVDDSEIEGVTEPTISFGMKGSLQRFRCHDYSFMTTCHMLGGIRFWIIIAQQSVSRFEQYVWHRDPDKNTPRKPSCLLGSQIVLDLEAFHRFNIKFKMIIQRENDSVVVMPGFYYYWVNLGDFTEVITSTVIDNDWFETGKKQEAERCNCRNTFSLNWTKIEEHMIRGGGAKAPKNKPQDEVTAECALKEESG